MELEQIIINLAPSLHQTFSLFYTGPYSKGHIMSYQGSLVDFGVSPVGSMPIFRELPEPFAPIPIPCLYNEQVQTQLPSYFTVPTPANELITLLNNVQVEPYKPGMPFDDYSKLFGSKSTAIIHDNLSGYDTHHHAKGEGAVFDKSKRLWNFKDL